MLCLLYKNNTYTPDSDLHYTDCKVAVTDILCICSYFFKYKYNFMTYLYFRKVIKFILYANLYFKMGCRHLFSSSVLLIRSVPYVKFYIKPKFLTLMPFLRKERIPYKQDTEELLLMKERKLAEIKELCADGNKEFTDNLSEQKEYLSMILYQFYRRGDEKNLLMVFDEINANGVLSETSYTILMRHYADCKNLNKVIDLFNAMRNDPNTLLGTRCYLPLIVSLLNFKQFDSASAYLREMLEAMKKSYNEKLFAEIIISCTGLRDEHSKHVEKIVTQIFDYMNSYGIEKVHSETVSAIKIWFERFEFI